MSGLMSRRESRFSPSTATAIRTPPTPAADSQTRPRHDDSKPVSSCPAALTESAGPEAADAADEREIELQSGDAVVIGERVLVVMECDEESVSVTVESIDGHIGFPCPG